MHQVVWSACDARGHPVVLRGAFARAAINGHAGVRSQRHHDKGAGFSSERSVTSSPSSLAAVSLASIMSAVRLEQLRDQTLRPVSLTLEVRPMTGSGRFDLGKLRLQCLDACLEGGDYSGDRGVTTR